MITTIWYICYIEPGIRPLSICVFLGLLLLYFGICQLFAANRGKRERLRILSAIPVSGVFIDLIFFLILVDWDIFRKMPIAMVGMGGAMAIPAWPMFLFLTGAVITLCNRMTSDK